MRYDAETHHRRSTRLKGYDYTQAGAYFVTICTQNRECLFGEVVDEMMHLNTHGVTVLEAWQDLPNHYPNVTLDAFVVMPNHVHGIIVLVTNDVPVTAGSTVWADCVGAGLKPAPTATVGADHVGAGSTVGVGSTVGAGLKPAPTTTTTQPVPTQPVPTQPVPTKPAPAGHGLPEIVRAFKTFSARRINAARQSPGLPLWQRNYYEHIIRDEESLNRIRQYIADNPIRWQMDRENPNALWPEPEEAWRA